MNRHQKGDGLLKFFIFILFLLVIAFFGLKILPAYLANWSVKETLREVQTDLILRSVSNPTLQSKVIQRLRVNGNHNFSTEDIMIKRINNNAREVIIKYEHRSHLVGNLDIVASFRETAVVPYKN